ncbi:SRPBCC family protein [Silvimonas sp. JCM 19000]
MWTHKESIAVAASAARIWALFADVAGWKHWNAGIARITLAGPFASGSTFLMELPDGTRLSSTLLDVQPGVGFTDETVIEGNQIRVHHRISALPDGGALITYATEIEGPQAAEFGAMVTGDFAEVLQALKAAAEQSTGS